MTQARADSLDHRVSFRVEWAIVTPKCYFVTPARYKGFGKPHYTQESKTSRPPCSLVGTVSLHTQLLGVMHIDLPVSA